MKMRACLTLLLGLSVLSGCPKKDQEATPANDEPLTVQEAGQALEEVGLSGEATSLIGGSIEITTDFTIGGAVEAAAAEIRDFIETQLPCAEITLEAATLTVEYGAKPGNCTYRGQTYSGVHSITVSANDEAEVLVRHEWDRLANQRVEVSGFADVTWSLSDGTRRVVHELDWTRLSDGRTGTGSGDRLQGALGGNIADGFTVDGTQGWDGQAGSWDLDLDGIEWRWIDPVPQAGTYTLTTPAEKELSLGFERLDEDTIEVTVSSGETSFTFEVNKTGAVEQPDGEG